jgi:hypothetical protein
VGSPVGRPRHPCEGSGPQRGRSGSGPGAKPGAVGHSQMWSGEVIYGAGPPFTCRNVGQVMRRSLGDLGCGPGGRGFKPCRSVPRRICAKEPPIAPSSPPETKRDFLYGFSRAGLRPAAVFATGRACGLAAGHAPAHGSSIGTSKRKRRRPVRGEGSRSCEHA